MHKLYLALALICCTSIAKAQFSAGDRLLGGSVSFNGQKGTPSGSDSKQFNFGIAPSFTHFKSATKADGVRFNVNYGEQKIVTGVNYQKADNLGLGLTFFNQRYFTLGKGFYFLVEKGITAGYTFSKVRQSAFAINEIKTQGFSGTLYLRPAVGHKITDRLFINLDLGNLAALTYGHTKTENTVGSTTTTDKNDAVSFYSTLNNLSLGDVAITFAWKLK